MALLPAPDTLLVPEFLKSLVALKVSAPVKLFDALQQR
jgi:hypothetical protein